MLNKQDEVFQVQKYEMRPGVDIKTEIETQGSEAVISQYFPHSLDSIHYLSK